MSVDSMDAEEKHPGIGNSRCKGPEVEVNQECWRQGAQSPGGLEGGGRERLQLQTVGVMGSFNCGSDTRPRPSREESP